eukprot:3592229-Rhodomonas_salina.3
MWGSISSTRMRVSASYIYSSCSTQGNGITESRESARRIAPQKLYRAMTATAQDGYIRLGSRPRTVPSAIALCSDSLNPALGPGVKALGAAVYPVGAAV